MYVDIDAEDVLMADSFGVFLGLPHTKEALVGTIDGTNKDFQVANYPIYPRSGLSILPQVSDVDVFGRKATVDTPLTAASIKTLTDAKTGDSVDGMIELSTAPAAANADSIIANYVEELQPFVTTNISPTVKQTTKDVSRVYSTTKLTAYGDIDIQVKLDQTVSRNSIEVMRRLLYEAYSGPGTVATGYKAWDLRKKPQSLYGYITMKYDEDFLGRIYMESCKLSPDLPGAKGGDVGSYSLNMSVASNPRLLMPDVTA